MFDSLLCKGLLYHMLAALMLCLIWHRSQRETLVCELGKYVVVLGNGDDVVLEQRRLGVMLLMDLPTTNASCPDSGGGES